MDGIIEGIRRSWSSGARSISDAWLVLQVLPGMTPERLHRLLEAFGGPQEALAAPVPDFARLGGRKAAEALEREAPHDLAARLRREAEAGGAGIMTRDQAAFPELLQAIFAAPGALYVEGRLEGGPALALVGTRHPSEYGRRMAREIAGALAAQGFTIVSGMAHGIDAEAHMGTLEAGGRTVAVLGCGLGVQYPSDHQELRAKIASQGAVVSEFPWAATPYPANFPRRNRVISGLSAATVVVEAAHRSGALLTAKLAAEQGREVMALPRWLPPLDQGGRPIGGGRRGHPGRAALLRPEPGRRPAFCSSSGKVRTCRAGGGGSLPPRVGSGAAGPPGDGRRLHRGPHPVTGPAARGGGRGAPPT
ncbi:MAG: DNA-protecting protein DprA [Candidatus Tectomicrobia bacterium]|nr:DNA-protecting protein DprA [Candidatus Tectomicrobia bacterium]